VSKLKAEGFGTVGEIISALHSVTAEKTTAEAARDTANAANDDFRNSLRDKGGQMATQKQEIERLTQENEQLKAGKPPADPNTPPPATPPAKSVEDELAEVEGAMTDEQWALADDMLGKMDDVDALLYTGDNKKRLELLKGLRNDPANAQAARPKSFRKTNDNTPPTKTAYELLKEKLYGTTPGPSGPPRTGVQARNGQAAAKPVPKWVRSH